MPINAEEIAMLCAKRAVLVAGFAGQPEELAAIADNHTGDREPYANMSRERLRQILEGAWEAKDARKWQEIEEYILDNMTTAELTAYNLATEIYQTILGVLERMPTPGAMFPAIGKIAEVAVSLVEDPGCPAED